MPLKSASLAGPDQKSDVVVVGGANLDVLGQSAAGLVVADSNPGRVRFAPGGVGRNVAENLARLGLPTRLLSAVGDDAAGRQLLAATGGAGVNVTSVLSVAGAATATYLALHSPDGDMAMAVNDMRVLDHLDATALHGCAAVLVQAAAVVVDANLGEPALTALFDSACSLATTPVFADAVSAAKCLRLKPWLPRLHTLKANALEAAMLLGHGTEAGSPIGGIPGNETRRIDWALEAASQLQAQGVRNVVVTLGALGACWCDGRGQAGHCAAAPVAVVSTAGAGDALLAGLVAMHLAGQPLSQALPWAMACAELTLLSGKANAPNLSPAAVTARLQLERKIAA